MFQKVKRGIVAALAIAMTATMGGFGLASSANADDTPAQTGTGSIIITGLSDNSVTVKAYKIIDESVDASNAPTSGLTWNDAVASWVRGNYSQYIGENNTVSKTYQDLTGDSTNDPTSGIDSTTNATTTGGVAEFLDKLAASGTLTKAQDSASSQEGADVTLNLPVGGYYIEITSTDGPYVYRAIAANVLPTQSNGQWTIAPQTITAKRSKASIDKVVNGDRTDKKINTGKDNKGQGSDTVSIGDTVTFDLYTDVPVYPSNAKNKQYLISDVMNDHQGLTFGSISSVEGVDASGNATSLQSGDNDAYTLNIPGTDAAGIVTTFTLKFNYEKIRAYKKIHVKYTATVNENAKPGTAMENDAKLQYSNNPYTNEGYHTEEDKTKVYTFGIKVFKQDESGKALTGAEFNLADSNNTTLQFVKLDDGQYRLAKEDEQGAEPTLAVDNNGRLDVYGLKGADASGNNLTYKLTETKAPDGYVKLTSPINVTLTPQKDNANDYTGTLSTTADAGYVTEKVTNQKSGTLPQTGGIGTIIFSVLGALMVAGGVLLIGSRRKKNA